MSNNEQSVAERLNNIAPDDEAKRDRFIEDELLISLLNGRNRIHRENAAGIAVTSELVFAYDTAIAERETVVGVLRRMDEQDAHWWRPFSTIWKKITRHKKPAIEFHLACELMLGAIAILVAIAWCHPEIVWFRTVTDFIAVFLGGGLTVVSVVFSIKHWREAPDA